MTPPAAPKPTSLTPYLLMLAGCVWFTLMLLLSHDLSLPAEPGGPPRCAWPVVAFVRSVVAFGCALILTKAAGAQLVFARPRVLWWRSVAGSVSMMATFYALAHMPVTDVLTLTNTTPIWVALLAWPMSRALQDRPTAGVWGAILVAVAGVGVALQPGRADFAPVPVAAALVAAFFTAVAMLGLNQLKQVHPFAVVTHFSAVSSAFGVGMWALAEAGFLPLDAAGDRRWFASAWVWVEILGVGVTATVGQVFLTLAYRRGIPTRVAVVGLMQVVMVMLGETLLGWKVVTPVMLAGTAMVVGSAAWLMVRDRRPDRRARTLPPAAPTEPVVQSVAKPRAVR